MTLVHCQVLNKCACNFVESRNAKSPCSCVQMKNNWNEENRRINAWLWFQAFFTSFDCYLSSAFQLSFNRISDIFCTSSPYRESTAYTGMPNRSSTFRFDSFFLLKHKQYVGDDWQTTTKKMFENEVVIEWYIVLFGEFRREKPSLARTQSKQILSWGILRSSATVHCIYISYWYYYQTFRSQSSIRYKMNKKAHAFQLQSCMQRTVLAASTEGERISKANLIRLESLYSFCVHVSLLFHFAPPDSKSA